MESKIFVVFVVEFVSCECSGLFLWYVDVQLCECCVFWSCKVGYMFDGMDMQMLLFVILMFVVIWGILFVDVGFIGMIMLFVLVFGGWIVGILFDWIGCVCML